MPKVIVPVGMMLGELVRPDAPEVAERWHISVGGSAEGLTSAEVKTWAAALADPQRHADLVITREALLTEIADVACDGVPEPMAVVDRLVARGLLVEFDPWHGEIENFARRHRLFPLGVGMGNTGEDPLLYRIAVGNQARIGVNGDVYALWSNSLYYLNLWESCEQFAKEMNANMLPGDEPPHLDTETVARELAANIPVLVSAECAFLDPVIDPT